MMCHAQFPGQQAEDQHHTLFKVKVKCCSKFLSCLFCGFVSIWQICFISMGQCKKDVTPLLTHWSYIFLALTHRYVVQIQPMRSWCVTHHFHFKGASHMGPLEVLAISTLSPCQFDWLICGPDTSQKDHFWVKRPMVKVTWVVGKFLWCQLPGYLTDSLHMRHK